jgi:hypothetical protein
MAESNVDQLVEKLFGAAVRVAAIVVGTAAIAVAA